MHTRRSYITRLPTRLRPDAILYTPIYRILTRARAHAHTPAWRYIEPCSFPLSGCSHLVLRYEIVKRGGEGWRWGRDGGGERDGDGGERGEEGGERDGDGRERGEDGGLREEGIKSSRVYVTKSLSQVYVIGWGREGGGGRGEGWRRAREGGGRWLERRRYKEQQSLCHKESITSLCHWVEERERGERGHDHDIMTLYITVPA